MWYSRAGTALLLTLTVALGGAVQAAEPWPGDYTSPHGIGLLLEDGGQGWLQGTLRVDGEQLPIRVQVAGSTLSGSFESGGTAFPVTIRHGEEPGQIVVESEGSLFELSRVQTASNPLTARAPGKSNPLASRDTPAPAASPGLNGNFNDPNGQFTMNVPPDWQANMMADDVFELLTGVPGDLVIVLLGELEPHEIGRPPIEVMPGAQAAVDDFLGRNAGVYADSSRATVTAATSGLMPAATSVRPAQGQGRTSTVWQGLIVDGAAAFMLIAAIPAGSEQRLMPVLEQGLASVRFGASVAAGGAAPAAGRRVVFNGQPQSAASLKELEGPTPLIPDGEYWYDNASGMVGTVGGPTEAYFRPGLKLGGELDPNASGGGTPVAFNGRYLHPVDLAGLQYYLGEFAPGRYWLDGQGNYGQEGGPRLGNLVEDIRAAQQLAAELLAVYQAQLAAQVQQYQTQGQGLYYGQGGGYADQGGSIYSHFPNLGASGTGVSAANLGGGDMIVNAGGVMWWPGK